MVGSVIRAELAGTGTNAAQRSCQGWRTAAKRMRSISRIDRDSGDCSN